MDLGRLYGTAGTSRRGADWTGSRVRAHDLRLAARVVMLGVLSRLMRHPGSIEVGFGRVQTHHNGIGPQIRGGARIRRRVGEDIAHTALRGAL